MRLKVKSFKKKPLVPNASFQSGVLACSKETPLPAGYNTGYRLLVPPLFNFNICLFDLRDREEFARRAEMCSAREHGSAKAMRSTLRAGGA
jgi:hypothetical protein